MNMEIIQSTAGTVLLNVSLAVITLLGTYAVYYIRLGAEKVKAQTAQITDDAGRKLLENALSDVVGLAELSVGAMEQTTAKTLREAVRNGTAEPGKLAALGTQVFNEVKTAIAPETQRVIAQNLGSFDAYLTKCIEDAVLRVKQKELYAALPLDSDFDARGLALKEPEASAESPAYKERP